VTRHFVVAKLCRRIRRSGRLISSCIRVRIASCDLSSHSNLTGFSGDCACALPCGEASLRHGKLVRGPGVNEGLRPKSMPWALTLSSLAGVK
jgi:hypothetical protein